MPPKSLNSWPNLKSGETVDYVFGRSSGGNPRRITVTTNDALDAGTADNNELLLLANINFIRGAVGIFDAQQGASSGGVTDNLAAWNTFIAAYDTVFIPPSSYLFSAPMNIPSGKTVIGAGKATKIIGTSGQPSVIAIGDGSTSTTEVKLRHVNIGGASDKALYVNNAQNIQLEGVKLETTGVFTDGFVFKTTWASSYRDLWTNGASISTSCFSFLDNYNACIAENLYTSNVCAQNFLMDATSAPGHGSHWSMITAQGGTIGLNCARYYAGVISGFYSENVVTAAKFGDKSTTKIAYGMEMSAPLLGGPVTSHTSYASRAAVLELSYVRGLTINSPVFNGAFDAASWAPVSFTGGGGSGAAAVAVVNTDGTLNNIVVLRGGSGYTSAPTVVIGGAGSSAAATANLTSQAVTSITITNAGTGYVPVGYCPVAIRYNDCAGVTIQDSYFNDGVNGLASPIHPYIVHKSGGSSAAGVALQNVISGRSSTNSASARMEKSQGFAYLHYLTEIDASGNDVRFSYTPPAF